MFHLGHPRILDQMSMAIIRLMVLATMKAHRCLFDVDVQGTLISRGHNDKRKLLSRSSHGLGSCKSRFPQEISHVICGKSHQFDYLLLITQHIIRGPNRAVSDSSGKCPERLTTIVLEIHHIRELLVDQPAWIICQGVPYLTRA